MTKKNNIEELKKVRKKIDNIDNKIIELIGDRFKEIHKVTKLKENREEIIDHERITHILTNALDIEKEFKVKWKLTRHETKTYEIEQLS